MKYFYTFLIAFLLTISSFSQSTFINPINQGQDPWVKKKDGFYYFVQSDLSSVLIWKSDKLTDMGIRRKVFTLPTTGWNTQDLWGTQLHYLQGKWYIMYTAGGNNGNFEDQRCGVLECSSQDPMTGTWVDKGMLYTGDNYTNGITPTVANTQYGIDMTYLEMNGQLYGLWSGWIDNTPPPAGQGKIQPLYIASMSNPWTISSNRIEFSRPTEPFELLNPNFQVNEGPTVLKHLNKIYVIYSANAGNSWQYNLGQLSIDATANPMNPSNWTKKGSQVFGATPNVYSAGRGVFTTSPDGTENWMLYHSKIYNNADWLRHARLKKFTWNPDGSPNFGFPEDAGTSMPVPAGEQNNVAGVSFSDQFTNGLWDNWRFYGWDHNIGVENDKMKLGGMRNFYFGDKAFVRGYDWTDFVYQADIKITYGTKDAGLIFRAHEPGFGWNRVKGYFAGISIANNKVYIGTVDGANFVELAAVTTTINLNQQYKLKIIAEGNVLKVYLDGALLLTTTDNTYTSGMCGATVVETEALIDNVSIELPTASNTNTGTTFVNAINQGQNPWVMKKDGMYYFTQGDSQLRNIMLWKSDKLTDMGTRRIAWTLPTTGWNGNDLWDTQIHYINNKWYITYTAGEIADGDYQDQRVGVLECTTQDPMTGSWIDKGMLYTGNNYTSGIVPTANNTEYAIDLTYLEMNGQLYGIWSGWVNTVPQPVGGMNQENLYIATMSNPWTITSNRVLLSEPTEAFELLNPNFKANEAPRVLKHTNKINVIYSTNAANSWEYSLGQISIDPTADPMVRSNWTKKTTAAFSATPTVYGTGAAAFATSPDDTENWILYHSKTFLNSDWQRDTRLQKFTFNPDGTPDFGTPIDARVSTPVPAGEQPNTNGGVFSDLFSDNTFDKWNFMGWEHNISVVNQEMHMGGIHNLYQGDKAMVRGYDWTDFIFQANIKMIYGTKDAGLIFRAHEAGFGVNNVKGYFAGVSMINGKVYIGKVDGNNFIELASTPVGIALNQQFRLKVEADGASIKVYIDGALYITTNDNSYSKGTCGLSVIETEAIFDWVNIDPLTNNPIGQAGVPIGTTNLCQGTTSTNFITTGANNATAYVWNIIPATAGTITGSSTTGTVTWNSSFSGNANITVYGTDGTDNGVVSDGITVKINAIATPIITGKSTICDGDSFLFTATNVNSKHHLLWSDGTTGNTMTGAAPVGDYTISLMVTDPISGCSAIGYYHPSVVALPYANIIGNTVYCEGDTYWFKAENLGNNTVVWQNSSVSSVLTGVAPVGNYELSILVTDPSTGCTNTDVKNAIVNNCLKKEIKSKATLSKLFSVYPNPATDVVNISGDSLIGNFITITNVLNQVVYHKNAVESQMRIDISKYESGIYFVNAGDRTTKLMVVD